jgi:Transglycosylase SLT domain
VPFDTPDVLASKPRRDHTVVRHVTRWSTGPVGRLFWPSALIALMLVIAGVGAKTFLPHAAVVKHTPGPIGITSALPPTDQPAQAQPLPTFATGTDQPTADAPLPINTVRPGDQLAAWATPLSTKLGIPAVALQAYGYGEEVATHNQPACRLTWTTLAGIGKIESDHGRAQGATLQPDGTSLPSIIGPPLDGQSGRKSIPDTDGGVLDGDRSWDRAVGPMQFIPSTWKQWGIDADGNGEIDINNIYDASVAAADYLCASGRDLSTGDGWHSAVSSYNAVQAYIDDVFAAANDYGRRSRS